MEGADTTASKQRRIPSPATQLTFMASQICLRAVAAAAALTAACVMLKSRQSQVLFGVDVDARYTYSPAFRYFVWMNVVAGALSVVSMFPVLTLGRKFNNSVKYFFFFLHDLVLTTLMMAGCGAATAIAYVGKNGNSHTGWTAVCDNFEKFCHKIAVSLILSYISTLCLLLLAIISANKSR